MEKPTALMIAYSGIDQYRLHFDTLSITSPIVATMVSSSIPISSILQKFEFTGFKITMDGIEPTKKMIEVILQFPTPANVTGIRS